MRNICFLMTMGISSLLVAPTWAATQKPASSIANSSKGWECLQQPPASFKPATQRALTGPEKGVVVGGAINSAGWGAAIGGVLGSVVGVRTGNPAAGAVFGASIGAAIFGGSAMDRSSQRLIDKNQELIKENKMRLVHSQAKSITGNQAIIQAVDGEVFGNLVLNARACVDQVQCYPPYGTSFSDARDAVNEIRRLKNLKPLNDDRLLALEILAVNQRMLECNYNFASLIKDFSPNSSATELATGVPEVSPLNSDSDQAQIH